MAAIGVELLANRAKPAGWFNPANPGDFGFVNSDLAFEGDHAFVGNFNGFLIYNIADPANPTLAHRRRVPGRPGRGLRLRATSSSCRPRRRAPAPTAARRPRRRAARSASAVCASSTSATWTRRCRWRPSRRCRGSHTHTVLKSPSDADNVYVYINGTGGVRPATEMASCKALPTGTPQTTPQFDEGLSQWRIEVVKVPLSRPAERSDRQRPAADARRDDRASSTASRTHRRRRCTRPGRTGRRRRRATRATTSRPTRRSASLPAPARGTGS